MPDLPERLTASLAGRYAIEREIGRGGMAVVFLAEDLKHNRRVALKVLRPEIADSIGTDRFLSEIQITARLDHPHILPLLDSGEADGFLYFVMPFVEGETLRDRLDREPQLPLDDALQITRDLASALDYAHEHGVIHRDLKPGNILLQSGHARLADFGIAHAVGEAGGQRLTAIGMSVGTPSFMSPEQAGGEEAAVDARSDIYSLACVLFEMLAGQPPFTGTSARTVLAKHLNEVPLPVTEVRANAGDAVASALAKALEKVPGDRQATAGEFAGDLIAGVPARSHPVTWVKPVAGIVAALAIVAAVSWATSRQNRQPEPALELNTNSLIDPNVVAIFPFRVVAPDTTLDWFAFGIGTELGYVFDGTNGPRAADPTVVQRAWDAVTESGAGEATNEELRLLAANLGYGQVLTGSVTASPPRVRVQAVIEGVDGRVLARADEAGSPDSLGDIVDKLAAKLAGRGAGEPLDRLRHLLGTSEPARRSYLAATRARRAGSYQEAQTHYLEALAADSGFALAALGLDQNAEWCLSCDTAAVEEVGVAEIILKNWDRLPVADQYLAKARGIGASSRAEQLAAAHQAVDSSPDRFEAKLRLADLYLHRGANLDIADHLAIAWDLFVEAFESDTLWVSAHKESVNHLVDLAILHRDTASIDRFLPLLDPDGNYGGFAHALLAAEATGDTAVLNSLRVALRGDPEPPRLWILVNEAPLLRAGYEDADYVAETIGAGAFPGLSYRYAINRGRPGIATDLTENNNRADWILVLDGLHAGGDVERAARAAERIRRILAEPNIEMTDTLRADRACALAQWHLGMAKADDASWAIEVLREVTNPIGEPHELDLDYGDLCLPVVEAWLAVLSDPSDSREALDRISDRMALQELQWEEQKLRRLNLALTSAWERAGDPARALATIRRRTMMLFITADLAQSLRAEGRLAAAVGDTAGAIYAYEYYLELRSDPEPEMLPEVEEVRTALAALTGE